MRVPCLATLGSTASEQGSPGISQRGIKRWYSKNRTFEEFQPNVRDSSWTFEIPGEGSRFRSNVRNFRRYFHMVERSRFQPNVRNFSRLFEIPVERSKFRPDVWKNENERLEFEAQKRAYRIYRRSKIHVLNKNINIPGSKILSENSPKMQKKQKRIFSCIFWEFTIFCIFNKVFYLVRVALG